MTLVVFTSSSEMVCTSERFARRAEGKAVGLETVTTVLEEVSARFVNSRCSQIIYDSVHIPLQFAPQTVQVKTTFCLPALPSSKFPQSVQNTRDPIADILRWCCWRSDSFGDVGDVGEKHFGDLQPRKEPCSPL
jgi:hypothetical protein